MKKTTVTLMASLILLVSSLFTPFAQYNKAEADQIEKLKDGLEETSQNLSKLEKSFEKVESNKDLNEIKKDVRTYIKQGNVDIHSNNQLDYKGISANRHLSNNNLYVNIPFKVKNKATSMQSIILVLKEDHSLINYSEIHLLSNEAALEGNISMWVNGVLEKDQTVHMPKQFFKDVSEPLDENVGMPVAKAGFSDWYDGFSNCLSSKGVSWSMITLAGMICGGACGATWGAGCAPCFYGLTFLSGFNIGDCFWKKY
jgi:hypothetical protein